MNTPHTSTPFSKSLNDYGLVVYDGFCVLCSGTVRFLLKIDRRKRLKFTTISRPENTAPERSPDFASPTTVFFILDHKIYTESEAILRIFCHIGGFWKSVNLFRIIPKRHRDLLYRFISRHRYRIFGKRQKCDVPAPEYAERYASPLKIDDLPG